MKKYSLFVGRFQVEKPHAGHIKLIRTILKEGKNVCIALREPDGKEENPYTFTERLLGFRKVFKKEMEEGTMIIIKLPDITEIIYGREVGYDIREIKLDKETEAISATNIRNG